MRNDLSLLYIEDDVEILENVSFLLGRYVGTVYSAENGEQALEMYKKHQPDIIVADIRLPKISGIDVSNIIRVKNKSIPIILISAHDEEEFLGKVKELNISAYIKKPFSLQDLTKGVKQAILEL